MGFDASIECARALDAADELAPFRRYFHLPKDADGSRLIYLCGHSLGLMPRRAAGLMEREIKRWSRRAVDGHMDADGWLEYHERFSPPLARLLGARPSEVVAMNSLTVNLHLMLVSFFQPTKQRHKILIERHAFPSDRYAVLSHLRLHGLDPEHALIELEPRPGQWTLDVDRLEEILAEKGERIALIMLPGVQYLSGQVLDIARITALGREVGAHVGFDMAHSVGNVPSSLHRWAPDFAVWCSYKYLNAGPGAVAGCFVHERWARDETLPRLAGWWGHDPARRFLMEREFSPSPGAEGWQISNPPVFAMAPLQASLEVFREAGFGRLRKKSIALTGYLRYLLETNLADRVTVLTPSRQRERGCQLSVKLALGADRAGQVARALRRAGIVADWRPPDVLRLAPAPLYNRFREVFDAVTSLERALP